MIAVQGSLSLAFFISINILIDSLLGYTVDVGSPVHAMFLRLLDVLTYVVVTVAFGAGAVVVVSELLLGAADYFKLIKEKTDDDIS